MNDDQRIDGMIDAMYEAAGQALAAGLHQCTNCQGWDTASQMEIYYDDCTELWICHTCIINNGGLTRQP